MEGEQFLLIKNLFGYRDATKAFTVHGRVVTVPGEDLDGQ